MSSPSPLPPPGDGRLPGSANPAPRPFATWTPAEKVRARILYRRHPSRVIAEMMGKPQAEVSALMRAMNIGDEPVPYRAAVDMMSEDERRGTTEAFARGAVTMDAATHRVMSKRSGGPVEPKLDPVVRHVFRRLRAQAGKDITYAEAGATYAAAVQNISTIRAALRVSDDPVEIINVRKVGYRLVERA